MKRLWLALSLLLVSSCSSVPVGSLFKLASLDEKDLIAIDARQVRARITLNDPAELKIRDVKLVLRFEYRGESQSEHRFLLNLIDNRTLESSKGFFTDTPKRHQYDFDIADSSISQFKKYQREFTKYGRPEKYYWTVYYYLKQQPKKDQPIDLDLELKLADNESYFYLLKGASLGAD